MKKIFLQFIVVFFMAGNLPAQITFQKTFGGNNFDAAYSVEQTADGGYVMVGETKSFAPASDASVFIIKTNANGDTLWTKTMGSQFDNQGTCVQQVLDGGLIICGGTTFFNGTQYDFYLIKLNSSGNLLWSKTYGGLNVDYAEFVRQTSDDGYIIVGSTESFSSGYNDVYLIKTDSLGNIIWAKNYGGIYPDVGYSVQQTTDGGYIIAGFTYSFGAGDADAYILKTDANGNLSWSITVGGIDADNATEAIQTSDGGYIIGGSTLNFGAGDYDAFIMKIGSGGEIIWFKTYGGIGADGIGKLQVIQDGGFIMAGSSSSYSSGAHDAAYLFKTDSIGNVQWSKIFDATNDDYAYDIKQTNDGGFIMAGSSDSFGAGASDVYLIKTDSAGNGGCFQYNLISLVSNVAITEDIPATVSSSGGNMFSPVTLSSHGGIVSTLCYNFPTIIPGNIPENNFSYFPNPAASQLNFSFPETGNYFLTIKNTLGETILVKSVTEKEFSVEVKDFPSGIYFITVTDEKKNIAVKKFVKM